MGEVSLTVDGQRHSGWLEVRIRRSLDYVAHSFELSLSEKWSDGARVQKRTILPGMPCKIHSNNDLILSGYVDEVLPSYDKQGHKLKVIGRSKVSDLVDCSFPGQSFTDQTLLQISRKLANVFNISVSLVADDDPVHDQPFPVKRLNPGQSIFEFLEQLARIRALRFVSDGDGNLTLVNAGRAGTATPLVLGENIHSASGSSSVRDRFSLYEGVGQNSNTDYDIQANSQINKFAEDDFGRYHRYRPKTFLLEAGATAEDAQTRANWQRNTAYGRSQGVIYSVTGWRQENGELWDFNKRVPVLDKWLGVDGERLIVDAQFIINASGEFTQLRVMPVEAYQLLPIKEKTNPESLF